MRTALVMVATAVTLLAVGSAHADTSWVRGGNWATGAGLVENIIQYPSGITSSTTPAQAAAVADAIANDYKNVGINFVRFPINPATVTSNWPVAQACINELLSQGLYVDICCWYVNPEPQGGNGFIRSMSTWQSMWQTIDSLYSSNNMVYYEAINEPSGYSLAGLETVYTTFLGFIHKSPGHIILDGTGYADDVTRIGANPAFSSCLLAVHDYAFWHSTYTNEAQWESELQGEVGSYASRTIMTEFGAPTTTGKNYQVSTNDNEISFLRGVCAQCRAWPMGSVWFPAHQPGNNNKKLFNGPGTGIINRSSVNELQYGWKR